MSEKKAKHAKEQAPSDGAPVQDNKPIEENTEQAGEINKESGAPAEELKKALAAAEDYKDKWYRVSAEYDNYRKRNSASVSQAYRDGMADAVLKLLPVADNFGYALASASDEKTKAGIDKIIKNFANILQSFGVEEIPVAVGDNFDESSMEAVMNTPCGEGEEPNKVSTVLKKGYKQGEKVIRFAQVAVTV